MRIATVLAAAILCGCHLIYPFATEGPDAGPGDAAVTEAAVTDGAGEGLLPSDGGGEGVSVDGGGVPRVVWVSTFGSLAGYASINDVAISSKSGAVHLTGSFSDQLDDDSTTLLNASGLSAQILVLTLDSAGKTLWARGYGGLGEDSGTALDWDLSTDSLFVVGSYEKGLDFKAGSIPTLPAAGGRDSFIARFDATGAPKLSGTLGGTSADLVQDVVVDGDGRVSVTGWFDSPKLKLGSALELARPTNVTEAAFFARYETSLAPVYGEVIGGSGHLRGQALAHNGGAEIYAAGYYSGWADVDGDPLATTGGATKEGFLVAFETKNAVHWAHNVNNIKQWDQLHGVAYLPPQKLLVAVGYFKLLSNFGSKSLANRGGEDAVMVTFDTAKEAFVDAWGLGGIKHDRALAVASDDAGNIYVTGYFEGAVNQHGVVLNSNTGSRDIFVASYTSAGSHRWSASYGGPKQDTPTAITVHSGYVYVTGLFADKAEFGPLKRAAQGVKDTFVLKLRAAP